MTSHYEISASVVLPKSVADWFPADDKVAFYSPNGSSLSYAGLQTQLSRVPILSWKRVAVLIPRHEPVDLAVALLSLMNAGTVSVCPLDTNLSPGDLTEALQQLRCDGVVISPSLDNKVKDICITSVSFAASFKADTNTGGKHTTITYALTHSFSLSASVSRSHFFYN